MKEKKLDEMKNVLELMKANNNFDVARFEEVVQDLETIIGEELDRADEQKMETELADNVKKALLKTLEGNADLNMISIIEQIVTQAGGEYRALKTKYMNDAVTFFIDYLGFEKTKTVEDEIDKELPDTDEQS